MSVKQTAWQIMIGCILFAAGLGLVQMASAQPAGLKRSSPFRSCFWF